MPTYDFYCQDCNKEFAIDMSMSEYEQTRDSQTCPGCGSANVVRKISSVEVQTSKKS